MFYRQLVILLLPVNIEAAGFGINADSALTHFFLLLYLFLTTLSRIGLHNGSHPPYSMSSSTSMPIFRDRGVIELII